MNTKGKHVIRGRFCKTAFIEYVPHLTIEDLQLVEYFDTQWVQMIQIRNVGNIKTYVCKLCRIAQNWEKNFKAHVEGKKHKLKMQTTKFLYHPNYTQQTKSTTMQNISATETIIKIAQYEAVNNNEDKKECKNNSAENERLPVKFNQSADPASKNQKPGDELLNRLEEDPLQGSSKIIVIDDDDIHSINSIRLGHQNKPVLNYSRNTDDITCIGEPLPKRQKIIRNPAAIYLKKGKIISATEDQKSISAPDTQYQPKVTVASTGNSKRHYETAGKSFTNKQLLSVETFSFDPKDDDVIGLVGVEYVLKILNKKNDDPQYECSLCELVLDGIDMQNHLVGYNHRLKFCEKHFPTAIRLFRQYMEKVPEYEIFKVMTPILAKLAVAIERYHGRDLPYECSKSDYASNRHDIFSKIFSCRHASEQYGPSFTQVVNSKEVDHLIANRSDYKPLVVNYNTSFDTKKRRDSLAFKQKITTKCVSKQSTNLSLDASSSKIWSLDDETHRLLVEDFLRDTAQSKKHNSRSSSGSYRISNKKKSISPLRENDIWQAYRHMFDQKVNDIDEVFQIYRSDPEQHPSYNEEWTMFWKRRKEELIESGLDHRTYNYQPEWVRFFKLRIEQLYNQAVYGAKIESRERLCLPLSNEPIELSAKYRIEKDLRISPNIFVESESTNDTKKLIAPQVIPVLRLMTALEEYLGSLGPKITELLSKSLQYDKNEPQLLRTWILKQENLSLIETAKEKFKGLVVAGLLDNKKERALKKCIDEIETFICAVEKNRNENWSHRTDFELSNSSVNAYSPSEETNFDNNGFALHALFAQDKRVIAVKLAALLAAQGKNDCSIDDLHQLISVYGFLEKKKKQEAAKINQKPLSDTLTEFLNQSSSNGNSSGDRSMEVNNSFQSIVLNSSSTLNKNLSSQIGQNNQLPSSQSNYSHNDILGENENFLMNTNYNNSNVNYENYSVRYQSQQQISSNCNSWENPQFWNQPASSKYNKSHAHVNSNINNKNLNFKNNIIENYNRENMMQYERNSFQRRNNCN